MISRRRIHTLLTAAICVSLVSNCTTDGEGGGASPGMNNPAWMDPIATLTVPPSGISELTYSTGRAFHLDLHASMKGAVPVISVAIPEGTPLSLSTLQQDRLSILQADPGIVRWTTRIRYTQGAVVACPVSEPETGIWSWLLVAANVIAPWVNEYLTYRVAENYNAVAWYDRGNERIQRIDFLHRGAVADINSMTCEQLSAL